MFELKVKSSESKGAVYFDNAAGRVHESTLTQKMVTEINAMGNVIDQNVEQTITLKLGKAD